MARQRLGQHFLTDLDWREQIARAIRVSPHSTAPLARDHGHSWIEIGAGHGEMTRHLLVAGCPVIAIELDPSLLAGLHRLAKEFPNLIVVAADILKADLATLAAGRRMRVYGNLPYYITSPTLHHLFEFASLIDDMHFVIQTEVAERLAAEPGTRDYGYLSVVTQFYTRPELVFEIPSEAFHPPPEVTSALVTLRLPGERAKLATLFRDAAERQRPSSLPKDTRAEGSLGSEAGFLDFVKLCFSQKRKMLANNLRSRTKPDKTREALRSLTLPPGARAEELTVVQLAALYVRLEGP